MNTTLLLGGVAATLVFGIVLLVSEARESRTGVWFSKPLAAAGFVACALGFGALESNYGLAILVGLCLSWLGDVLLMAGGRGNSFLLGIVSFFLAHCAYIVAFIGLAPDWQVAAVAALVMAILLALFMRWIWPYLEGAFRWAVLAYVIVIGIMVALAAGASAATGNLALVAGAVLFAISDVFVARDRFVQAGFTNRRWGLPLYFLGQLVLAASVASPLVQGPQQLEQAAPAPLAVPARSEP
jgi:uncharacterized membrane protein YhhN